MFGRFKVSGKSFHGEIVVGKKHKIVYQLDRKYETFYADYDDINDEEKPEMYYEQHDITMA